jgi:hypothetical protein
MLSSKADAQHPATTFVIPGLTRNPCSHQRRMRSIRQPHPAPFYHDEIAFDLRVHHEHQDHRRAYRAMLAALATIRDNRYDGIVLESQKTVWRGTTSSVSDGTETPFE